MGIYNKIIINDEVIIDLSNDTVIENKLIEGVTAHNAEGLQITGNIKKYNGEYEGDIEVLKATMYSYNGTVLPALPEQNKEQYPYAYISQKSDGTINLYFTDTRLRFYFDAVGTGGLSEYTRDVYTLTDNTWVEIDKGVSTNGSVANSSTQTMIWSNTDVLNVSGNIWFAASEPAPVYN